MGKQDNCPKCGAEVSDGDPSSCTPGAYVRWMCDSGQYTGGKPWQSPQCRITELEATVERLKDDLMVEDTRCRTENFGRRLLKSQVKALKATVERLEIELQRWSTRLDFVHKEYDVDGSGCDSADPVDVIECEIRLAIAKESDKVEAVVERLQKVRDAAVEAWATYPDTSDYDRVKAAMAALKEA